MGYSNSQEVTFSVLSGGGRASFTELWERMKYFGNDGFGEGISGRAKYVGGASQHRGTGTLAIMSFNVEYDLDEDLEAIKRELEKALTTEHSGVL